ncbi:MAG: DUF192 domain-containing protein [Rhizomicrobium sp.]
MRMSFAAFALVLLAAVPASAAPRLPVETVVIQTGHGEHAFQMEVAADETSRATGLMRRTHLARDAGMLFDFRTVVMTAFWMKDTPLPLDIIFVRADGTISTIAANAVPYSTAEIAAAEPIRAVIEIRGGLSRELGIVPGNRVRAPIFTEPSRH